MSRPTELSPAEAQKLVERIASSYGWLPQSEREQMSPKALELLANVETVYSAPARDLVRDVRNNKASFVLELIKNAEDNEYNSIEESAEEPCIKFSIHPDRIVVENNEHGFSVEDFESICKVGVSTKKRNASHYYIGDKGVGFKSVFYVASKVCIQSGPFSFSFEQPSLYDASGMGMITPVQFVSEEPLQLPVTKITLMLRDHVNGEEVDKDFFQELPDTLLLFTKKLKKVVITKYDATGAVSRYTVYTWNCDKNQTVTLTKVCQSGNAPPETSVSRFFTAKMQLTNLPGDGYRDDSTVELALAFPVDGNDVPVIGAQGIHKYFPIRRSAFPFLIQSDFITQTKWPYFVVCPQNRTIIEDIPRLFVDCMVRFCHHPTLRYQWMRYLPQFRDSGLGELWTDLLAKIQAILKETPVIYSYDQSERRLISEMRFIPPEFKDALGRPLFLDAPKSTYLAMEYENSDISALRSLGLRDLSINDVIDRVNQDIGSNSSRLRSNTTSLDWYSRATKFLLNSFTGQIVPRLKVMKLIPLLQDDNFASALGGPVYFPDTDRILIPSDLGLRLVKPGSIKDNMWRKKLFSALGVIDACVPEVRKLILKKYRRNILLQPPITLDQSVAHLRYLYWTHQMSRPKQSKDFFRNTPSEDGMESLPFRERRMKIQKDHMKTSPNNLSRGPSRWESSATPATSSAFADATGSNGSLLGNTNIQSPSPSHNLPIGGSGVSEKPSAREADLFFNSKPTIMTTTFFQDIKPSIHPIGFSSKLTIRERLAMAIPRVNCPGTRDLPYQPTIQKEANSEFGEEVYQSICRQYGYQDFSYEELRLADYIATNSEYEPILVFNQHMALVPSRSSLYLYSEGEFGIGRLLEASSVDGYPGAPVSYLHYSYLGSPPTTLGNTTWSSTNWECWLEEHLGILRQPRLVDPDDPTKLSRVFHHIATFKPGKFLGTLKTHWETYKEIMTPSIVEAISNVRVPCETGDKRELKCTFLPILGEFSQKFLRGKETLPSLVLYPPASHGEWVFLTNFGVRAYKDVRLRLLECIRAANPDAARLQEPERVFRLYKAIDEENWKEEDMELITEGQKRILTFFERDKALYLPKHDGIEAKWVSPSECVWEPPIYLKSRYNLAEIEEFRGSPILTDFLCNTLMISNPTWGVLMDELEARSALKETNQADIFAIYHQLNELRRSADETDSAYIRNRFRSRNVVFAPPYGWHRPEECIWYDQVQIGNKVPIMNYYFSLREFFVEFIGVKVPDLGMLVKGLERVAATTRSVESAKSLIWQINSLNPTSQDLAALQTLPIFPVRVGNVEPQLQSRERDFAIVDREKLAYAFTNSGVGPIAMLDFQKLEDVHKLRPILSALEVEDRYLSNVVKETACLSRPRSGLEQDEVLTINLRRRAYALYRIAAHFRSPRAQHANRLLYRALLRAQVIQTGTLASKFELTQNGTKLETEIAKDGIYIEEVVSGLNIYVPKSLNDRELSYRRSLPRELMFVLMKEGLERRTISLEQTAVSLISDILSCSDPIIDDILEDAGVVKVPFADEYTPFRLRVHDFSIYGMAEDRPLSMKPRCKVPIRLPGQTTKRFVTASPALEELHSNMSDRQYIRNSD